MTSYDLRSERFIAIYDQYYISRFSKRFDYFVELFKAMENAYKPNRFGVDLVVDLEKLAQVVQSYFLDVIRYKEYHFTVGVEADPLSLDWIREIHEYKRVNSSKVAAFSTKWILRHRPISYKKVEFLGAAGGCQDIHLEFINEHYALLLTCQALGIVLRDINPNKYSELLYYLRYRNFDEVAGSMLLSRDYLCAEQTWV